MICRRFANAEKVIELLDHFERFARDAVAKRRLVLVFWAAFLALFLQSFDAIAQAAAAVTCESCHGVPGLQKEREGKTVSLQVDKEMFADSVHGALGCANCHTDIAQFPHPSQVTPVDCSICHAGQVQSYADSIHGEALPAARLKERVAEEETASEAKADPNGLKIPKANERFLRPILNSAVPRHYID